MTKRLINIIIMSTVSMWALTGCDNGANNIDTTSNKTAALKSQTTTPESSEMSSVDPKSSGVSDTVDWSAMDSGQKAADRANYDYPFALDSASVQSYADYFKVDNATAQYNLTVSMASNEALSKTLDQLSDSYASHELTDGENMELIIHTTPDIKPDRYDYVITGDFAKGLVLPIVIRPDGKKSEGDVHGEMAE